MKVVIPYKPRDLQRAIHESLDRHRFGVVVCHRRFGKTVLAVNHLNERTLMTRREAVRTGYIAPTYKMAKNIAWDYVKKFAGPIPGVTFNEQELRADYPNGGRLRLFGADNPDSLRGGYFDDVVLDEYGLMDGRTWSEVVRPMLSDRIGGALFIGTPNGRNQFSEVRDYAAAGHAGWFLATHKASETKIIAQSELDDARRQMTEDEYMQEFECSFEASVKGAVYMKELPQAHVGRVPYARELPVHTYWDLGVGDATAIWFAQRARGGEPRIIDYYEASGEGLPHYADVLAKKGYSYRKHWAPHDIRVRELGNGRSRIETARALGINFEIVPDLSLEDGIHAARLLLPTCAFDAERCGPGIEALKNYRWAYNTALGEFKPTPVHDRWSHGADAFRYLAVAMKEEKPAAKIVMPARTGGWMS